MKPLHRRTSKAKLLQKKASSKVGKAPKKMKLNKLELSESPLQYLNTILTDVPVFMLEHVGEYELANDEETRSVLHVRSSQLPVRGTLKFLPGFFSPLSSVRIPNFPDGPIHDPVFSATVEVSGKVFKGFGRSKQHAKQITALEVLKVSPVNSSETAPSLYIPSARSMRGRLGSSISDSTIQRFHR